MTHRKSRPPKEGDRVVVLGHTGAFVISDLDCDLRTVELKAIGHEFALSTVPWSALTSLDEEDASEAVARIAKDATKSK
jgi:hypothetical protein